MKQRALVARPWVPDASEALVQRVAEEVAASSVDEVATRLDALIDENQAIHERDCINLNPAANVMNPRAEAALARGLGSRPSLGYPGAKYETGLEAIERIEVIAAELAAEVFGAPHAEIRVGSGAMANLYTFMSCCRPGDPILVPPATIGGHVTHNTAGAAGLYGLAIHEAPVDAARYSIDIDGLARLSRDVGPKLITVGASLNLFPHPVADIRAIADEVGAKVLFDAAHLSGLIAGGAWPDPLVEGAHAMTMSTYKSLGGPPAGLLVTTDSGIAERVDAIAFPGLTANFDVANSAALAITLLDWIVHGRAYARAIVDAAAELATALIDAGVPVYAAADGATRSHAFALDARGLGGGDATARRLRGANLLVSAIGLPVAAEGGLDPLDAGVRLGTNEIVRWGMTPGDMAELAELVAAALHGEPEAVASKVTALRRRFSTVHFVR